VTSGFGMLSDAHTHAAGALAERRHRHAFRTRSAPIVSFPICFVISRLLAGSVKPECGAGLWARLIRS
jgi:hypothetical protein